MKTHTKNLHGRERKTERRAAKQKASRLKTELCRLNQGGTEDSHQLEQSCAEQEERAVRQDMCVYKIKTAGDQQGQAVPIRSGRQQSSRAGCADQIRTEDSHTSEDRQG